MAETKSELKKTTRINSTIKADLERQFRETVYEVYGFKKGNLQIGLEDAIEDWIKKQSGKKRGEN